ncbi:MAG: beta-lactamase family protein [Clostridiales bacterium]|nr:beta-lactamase family protein [Clostridiales bacterium]
MDFNGFVSDIISNNWNVFGAEVYENGHLAESFGDTNDNFHDIYSATKTVLSIALGIAYDEGLIDLDRSVLYYLPDANVSKMPEARRKAFELITIRRLLTMSVEDLPFRPADDAESYLDFSLSCDIRHPERKSFNYSNISSYLVGVALTGALGRDLGGFIEERILDPLGIERYEYGRCPEGYFYGASRMKLTVNGLSRIGLLLCNKGEYRGKRIVSEEYVSMATSIQQMNREGGYGFFIWKYKEGFSINGKLKQKCYVLPDRGLVITYLSHIEDESNALKESMEKHILGE